MFRRLLPICSVLLLVIALAGCHHNKKVNNPLANVGSKQPDKVLFDRAMDQMKHNRMDQARIILQTLINTYPDSEYIARAKLAVGDSWYAEGGSAALAQAENEYKDFETFFPNMPEAAEAQLKIANIHFRQMEKPDRDFTHAMRAEEEYRYLVQQYPDSKLVPEAKARLLEVQEVLAEREFRIGHFYYLRESWAAAEARLQSLVDQYPLYSNADEALFLLGGAYEHQAEQLRAANFNEVAKGKLIHAFTDKAAEAYARILTRYPVMDRAADARRRLEALRRPVPAASPQAIAQNKAEVQSRGELGRFQRLMLNMHRSPDTSMAVRKGEPTLVDPKPTNAPDIVRADTTAIKTAASGGSGSVSIETVKPGAAPPPNQPVPRSDTQPAAGTQPATGAAATQPASGDANSPDNAIPELKPLPSSTDSGNASEPASSSSAPTPPAQMNEASGDQSNAAKTSADSSSSSTADSGADKDTTSTSKKKKKKGLGKLNPF